MYWVQFALDYCKELVLSFQFAQRNLNDLKLKHKELGEQAYNEFSIAWKYLGNRKIELLKFYGSESKLQEPFIDDGIVIASLQKTNGLLNQHSRHLTGASHMITNSRLVVFDEAHRSVARTYKSVTEQFASDDQTDLIGLTATPGRTLDYEYEDLQLKEMYNSNKFGLK